MDKGEKMDKKNCCCFGGCDDCEDCKGYNWKKHHWHNRGGGGNGAVYGLGFIGALIYYFGHASTNMDFVYGALKAIVWPAYLIHKLFTLLGM